jgi:hypothetical protein
MIFENPFSSIGFCLLSMIFMHCIADYFLQGCLSGMKQVSFWNSELKRMHATKEQKESYSCDFIAALFCHSFEWSFLVCLPLMLGGFLSGEGFFVAVLANTAVHMYVDNVKANQHIINLVQDQLAHFGQLILTIVLSI